MEEKLEEYRAKQRRQATINAVKGKVLNMVSFQGKSDAKDQHIIDTDKVSTYTQLQFST